MIAFFDIIIYNPVFNSLLAIKVLRPALVADLGTFTFFTSARYAVYFFVCEQIFFIFLMGMICFEVQKPNASCSASVNGVRV